MRHPNPALKTDWFIFADVPAVAGYPTRYRVLRRDEYGRTERFGGAVPQPWEFDFKEALKQANRLNSSSR